jgi:ATP-dependent DNA helicase RecG
MINKGMSLSTPVGKIAGVGEKYSHLLKSLGIKNIRDLLFYFPRRWDDFSNITSINKVSDNSSVTIKGTVWQIKNQRSKVKRRFLTIATLADETGTIDVIWYGQPYITKNIKNNDEVILSGRVSENKNKFTLQNPTYEALKGNGDGLETVHVGRIVPVYAETEGLSSRWLRFKIKPLLFLADKVRDYLPEEIKKSQGLMFLPEAIKQVHFPDDNEKLRKAKYRLAFDELFLIQLSNFKQKLAWQENKGISIRFDQKLINDFVSLLPFKLTDSQKKSSWEILKDLEKQIPMNRLLEGDVGSGKTVVASIAILETVKNGHQVAYMAPTEILAQQHYKTIGKLFELFDVKISLLLGSTKPKEKEKITNAIKNKKTDLVIGTHALLQEHINFPNLALVIIDEQHRFGVEQRSTLRKKIKGKFFPHLLTMTATPIPRTLALALYGDLDLSIISEMPPGRQKVISKIVRPLERKKTYDFIKKEVKIGNRVFVVCPLIEESDQLGIKSTKEEYKKLSVRIFPDLKIGMLHGRMKGQEKDEIMKRFKDGKINILVSTSVVEVGIDIPEATVMMIEGAERFGLAQLHQFRGRVGRGIHQSYCFLFTDKPSGNTFKRLYALIRSDNGFELAEKDLSIRGPGEIYGLKQHGIPDLKMASLTDFDLIKEARKEAVKILRVDPKLKSYPGLIKEMQYFKIFRHLE